MKKIQISQKNFQAMSNLYDNYYKIYGDENTIWNIEDLEEMRKMGQEFMNIFAINFKK
ncbi:hypothetical protein HZC33_03270 [Candidatus Wolfebacteria bacterium]|nr:hypothetical protein [Candidatus Wolfebacteria bacterium]